MFNSKELMAKIIKLYNNLMLFIIILIISQQFEDYLTDLIKSLPQIFEMNETFEKFYVCIAARKFFFFLDPRHKGIFT